MTKPPKKSVNTCKLTIERTILGTHANTLFKQNKTKKLESALHLLPQRPTLAAQLTICKAWESSLALTPQWDVSLQILGSVACEDSHRAQTHDAAAYWCEPCTLWLILTLTALTENLIFVRRFYLFSLWFSYKRLYHISRTRNKKARVRLDMFTTEWNQTLGIRLGLPYWLWQICYVL